MIMCGLTTGYSQPDCFKELQKLTLLNDSLKKQVIGPLNDSLLKVKVEYRSEIESFNGQLSALDKEKSAFEKKIEMLESTVSVLSIANGIKVTDSLKIKVDLLAKDLAVSKEIIHQKDIQITKEKVLADNRYIEGEKKGRKESYDRIKEAYNKPFDELIESSTIESVRRDIFLAGNVISFQNKRENLLLYLHSDAVLKEKFNDWKIEKALSDLNKLEQTTLVKNLSEKLQQYKLYNDELISTIEKIIEIDKRFVANDVEQVQRMKKQDVLFEISEYGKGFYRLVDYPYLSKLVLDLILIKSKNVDADISHLKEKL